MLPAQCKVLFPLWFVPFINAFISLTAVVRVYHLFFITTTQESATANLLFLVQLQLQPDVLSKKSVEIYNSMLKTKLLSQVCYELS